jgi:hypothetical protein
MHVGAVCGLIVLNRWLLVYSFGYWCIANGAPRAP